ncbi:MAG: NADH-quinone oxidoreductase subunit NuoK [Fimbriiglobus sp.]
MNELGIAPFVILSAFLFAIGVACFITKRNAIGLLMGIELILNAGNLNLVAAARYWPSFRLEGQVFAVMVIVLAAAEAAIALAIFLHLYNTHATVNVDDATDLKG